MAFKETSKVKSQHEITEFLKKKVINKKELLKDFFA
jgi:hypothetical protein